MAERPNHNPNRDHKPGGLRGWARSAVLGTAAAGAAVFAVRQDAQADGEVFFNGPAQAGPNGLVWKDAAGQPSPASEVVLEIERQIAGLDVSALWLFKDGQWRYSLPKFPQSISTLVTLPPLASMVAVLEPGAFAPPAVTPRPAETPKIKEKLNKELAQRVFELINETRQKEGKGTLRSDPRLQAAAEKYAEFLYRAGYPGGLDPNVNPHRLDGTAGQRAQREGYPHSRVGEVIAATITVGGDNNVYAGRIINFWIVTSPPHREVVLDNRGVEVGVGCFEGPDGEFTKGIRTTLVICVADIAAQG